MTLISYAGSTECMSAEELERGKQWLHDTFYLIRCDDDSLPSIEWVLQAARAAVRLYGVRGLLIDPYNELDHQRAANQYHFDAFILYCGIGAQIMLLFSITIHRKRDKNVAPLDLVQVCVRKVRNKVAGCSGEAFLSYDRVTGIFKDVDDGAKKHDQKGWQMNTRP